MNKFDYNYWIKIINTVCTNNGEDRMLSSWRDDDILFEKIADRLYITITYHDISIMCIVYFQSNDYAIYFKHEGTVTFHNPYGPATIFGHLMSDEISLDYYLDGINITNWLIETGYRMPLTDKQMYHFRMKHR